MDEYSEYEKRCAAGMWDKLENLNVYKKVKISSREMLHMIFSLLN